jgi:type I restriction enzyme, S subunit
MIRTTNVRGGRVDLGQVRYVEEDVYRKWIRRGAPKSGDIILTREAPLGEVGMLMEDSGIFLGQRLVLYRADPQEADRNFLLGAMQAPDVQSQIKAFGSGATVEHMRVPDCGELLIDCPPLDVQRKIGAVLAAFNELIEINERRIELLEGLARSLYREWFVHFRFPGHESHKLVNTDIGSIPDGWEVHTVGQVATAIRGQSYRRADLSEAGGVPFLNLKCMERGGGFRRHGIKRYTGRYKESQRTLPGDTLVAVTDMTQERRIVAQAFRMPDLGEPFAIPSLDLVLLRPIDQRMQAFIYATLRYSGFAERVKQFANGANVLHLSVDRIQEYRFAIPGTRLLKMFESMADAIFTEAELLKTQSQQLSVIRGLLLSRLVSGRLDIVDMNLGILTPTEPE